MINHPRPPPRLWPLVLATLIGIAILIWLGVWQVQRLHWKQDLLAELAMRAKAEPVDLASAQEIAKDGNTEFLKVRFRATYNHTAGMKMISAYEGGQGWTIITPAISADGYGVIVDRGRLPDQWLDGFDKPQGEVEITGIVRPYSHGRAYFDPDNDPEANLWYWWDVPAMLAAAGLSADPKPVPFVVQLLPGAARAEFPKPPEPKANLRNNHLGYALTWFGLAIALAVISGVYIRTLKNTGESQPLPPPD